jgi:anti-anti-sigma factor
MGEVTLHVWPGGDVHVVAVAGAVDVPAAEQLRSVLFASVDAGIRTLVVDLSRVRHLDLSAVDVLVAVADRLGDAGGVVRARAPSRPALSALEAAGVVTRLHAHDVTDPPAATAADVVDIVVSQTADGWWGDEVDAILDRLHRLPTDAVAARRESRDQAILLCLPFVQRLARRFDGGEPGDDLDQAAVVGLNKAIDRYDPTGGTGFASFATPAVARELRRHFQNRS